MLIFRKINGKIVPLQVNSIHQNTKVGLIKELKSNQSSAIGKTTCPICNAPVYFLRANGGCFWVEELGYPWEKHSCMSNTIKEKDKKNKYIPNGYISIDKLKKSYSPNAILGVIYQINFYKTLDNQNIALFLKTKAEKTIVVLINTQPDIDTWLNELCVIENKHISQFRDDLLNIKYLDIYSLTDFERQIEIHKYPQPRNVAIIKKEQTNLSNKPIVSTQQSNFIHNINDTIIKEIYENNYFQNLIKLKTKNTFLIKACIEIEKDLYTTPLSHQIITKLKELLLIEKKKYELPHDILANRSYRIIIEIYLDALNDKNLSLHKLINDTSKFTLDFLSKNKQNIQFLNKLKISIIKFIEIQPIHIKYIDYILKKFNILNKNIGNIEKPYIWQNEYDINQDDDLKELLFLITHEIHFIEFQKFNQKIGENPSKLLSNILEIINFFITKKQQNLLERLYSNIYYKRNVVITHTNFNKTKSENQKNIAKLNLILQKHMAMNTIQTTPLIDFSDLISKLNSLLPKNLKLFKIE